MSRISRGCLTGSSPTSHPSPGKDPPPSPPAPPGPTGAVEDLAGQIPGPADQPNAGFGEAAGRHAKPKIIGGTGSAHGLRLQNTSPWAFAPLTHSSWPCEAHFACLHGPGRPSGLHRRSVNPRARRHAYCPDLDGQRLDRRRTGIHAYRCHFGHLWSSRSVTSAGVLRCDRALRPSAWLVLACRHDVTVHPAHPPLADEVVHERICPVPLPGEPAPQLRLGRDD